jgi:hypothetical protein
MSPCSRNEQCAEGHHCDGQRCRPFVESIDSTCDGTRFRCSPHLYCVRGRCYPRPDVGEACADDAPCMSQLWCNDESTCVYLAEGDECGRPEQPSCPDGTVCDSTTSRCLLLVEAYEECATNDQCGPAAYCRAFEGRCSPRQEPYEPCGSDNRCTMGHYCTTKKICAALAMEGVPCEQDSSCVDGLYCHESWGICLPRQTDLPAGQLCRVDTDCRSGLCENQVCVAGCTGGL